MKLQCLFSRVLLFVLAATAASCSDEPGAPATDRSPAVPIDPPMECAAGTMPMLASGACEPVGPTSCSEGFQASPSGWGCAPIRPEQPCTGDTRAELGQTVCLPVDDCDAPFPPPGVDAVVHDQASLNKAFETNKSEMTIALDSGVYDGVGPVPRRIKDLRLVGRCASKVTLRGSSTWGVFADMEQRVAVESVTFEGFRNGIVAALGAELLAKRVVVRDVQVAFGVVDRKSKLTVQDSVAERTVALPDSETPWGFLAAGDGGTALVENTETRGYAHIVDVSAGSKVVVRRSVLTDLAAGRVSSRVLARLGSEVSFETSAIEINGGLFAFVGRWEGDPDVAPARLSLTNTTLTQMGSEADEKLGYVDEGALLLDGATIEHRGILAWEVRGIRSSLRAERSSIRGNLKSNTMRAGLFVDEGAKAEIDGLAIVDAQDFGVLAAHSGTRVQMRRSLVQETGPSVTRLDPRLGAMGVGLSAIFGATVSLDECAIRSSTQAGVVAADASLEIRRSLVDATRSSPEGKGGFAIEAVDGAFVVVDESLVRATAWVALAFGNPSTRGVVRRSRFIDNPVGVMISEVEVVQAEDDVLQPSSGQLTLFANVFEGTSTLVHEQEIIDTTPTPLKP